MHLPGHKDEFFPHLAAMLIQDSASINLLINRLLAVESDNGQKQSGKHEKARE